jgi:hypothetical protein
MYSLASDARNTTGPSRSPGRTRRHRTDAVLAADVQLERHRAAAQRLDLRLESRQRVEPPAGDHEIGAGARQRPRERLPEPAAGARHDGDLSTEIESAHG